MELRAERGRALVSGAPDRFEPPPALRGDLREWAEVAAAVCDGDEPDPDAAALVSARGRQLAARLATAAGTTVGYTDPVGGATERVPDPAAERRPAAERVPDHTAAAERRPAAEPGPDHTAATERRTATAPVPPRGPASHGPAWHAAAWHDSSADPASGRAAMPGAADPAGPRSRPPGGTGVDGTAGPGGAEEPTPWATGLTVSAFVGMITLAAVVTLVRGLAELGWLLGVGGLVVVTAGLAPSIWLARHTPLWRWVGYGVAAGLAVSWVSSAFASLG